MNEHDQDYSSKNVRLQGESADGFTKERYAQFAKHLPVGTGKVLDVGSNDGVGGTALKEIRPDVQLFGLDCVEDWLQHLPSAYEGGIKAFTNEIPVPDCHFKAIVAGEFLEHLYPRDVDATLAEFQRILEIGGRLLLTTPNPGSFKLRWRKSTIFGRSHLTQHHAHALKMRLEMHGFSKVRFIGSGKATRKVGEWCPVLNVYGSYLAIADKW